MTNFDREEARRVAMLARGLLLGLTLAICALPAFAAISLTLAPNYDATRTTAYPLGNKPIDTPTCPTGWTCANKGDGGGTIDEVSASEFDFNVDGSSSRDNFRYVYKDVASGDFQLVARITDEYAGSLSNFAGIGLGLSDGTADGDYYHNCFSPNAGASAARSVFGLPPDTPTAVNGTLTARSIYLASTYDESATESKCFESSNGTTWVEVNTVDRAYTSPIVYLYGQSGSSTLTMQGTANSIDLDTGPGSITVYTPSDPPAGTPPVLVTPIANQSAQQAVAFSLDFRSAFTGATSHTVSGLPGAGGLSESSDGVISGTPDADDFAASPISVTVAGVNVDGSTPDTFTITVSAPAGSGDVFTIPTSATSRTLLCNSDTAYGTTSWNSLTPSNVTRPDAGDTFVLAGPPGTHNTLIFKNCNGSSASPITIQNDTTDTGPATVSVVGSPGIGIENSTNITVTGLGKWSGAPAGTCGYDPETGVKGTTQCGIVIESADTSNPTHYYRIDGQVSRGITTLGVEIDGTGATGGGSGIGFSLNDHNFIFANCAGGVSNPNCWREDITFENNYVHHVGSANSGEGLYLGPNAYGRDGGDDPDLPLRRIAVRFNLVENTRRNGIELKYLLEGPNYIDGNFVENTGLSGEAGQGGGITVSSGGEVDITRNTVLNAGGFGINCNQQGATPAFTPSDGPYSCTISNNVVYSPGNHCFAAVVNASNGTPGGVGQNIPGVRTQLSPVLIEYNTCVESGGSCVNGSNLTATRNAANMICAGPTAGSQAVNGIPDSNNRKGTVASQDFLDAGARDYHLTATSDACNQGGSGTTPDEDFEGDSRPLDSEADQGADEAAACP